ncbi:MAG: hypothetical protein R3326_07360 [Gemmatimonadota bacterium]|nr:hypothetical protein [Gemmatimonadota bacterium]
MSDRPDSPAPRLAPLVAGGLLGLLAGVVIDIAWLAWSGWGVLVGVAIGTVIGGMLGRRDRG